MSPTLDLKYRQAPVVTVHAVLSESKLFSEYFLPKIVFKGKECDNLACTAKQLWGITNPGTQRSYMAVLPLGTEELNCRQRH